MSDYITLPDGNRAYPTELSFKKFIRNKHGKQISIDYLFVPDEEYIQGNITGLKCFAELLDYAKDNPIGIADLIDEISAATITPFANKRESSKRGAAIAIIAGIEEAIKFLARHSDYQQWIDRDIATLQRAGQQKKKGAFNE